MTEAAVSFAGNLTDDPEAAATEGGIARAMFRVAVSAAGSRRRRSSPSWCGATRPSTPRSPWRRAAGWWSWAGSSSGAWTAEDGSARSVVEVVRDHLEEIRDETGYSVPAGVADEIASLVERLR